MITKRVFPFVPLFDLAGVVVAVGDSVHRFRIGDRVHCDNKMEGGGAAQFVNVEEELVSIVPPSLSFAAAAAIPLAGQTALQSLDRAALKPGDSLCVIGASGGVGSFVVQMAKSLGVSRIIAVCSERNAEYVLSLGADEVVDYRKSGIEAMLAPGSIDAIIDCVGGKAQWVAAKRVLRSGGRFVTIARDDDSKVTFGAIFRLVPPVLWRMFSSHFGRKLNYLMVFLDANHALLDRVNEMVASGTVKPHIARIFDFIDAGLVSALELSQEGRVTGKLVVTRSADCDGGLEVPDGAQSSC